MKITYKYYTVKYTNIFTQKKKIFNKKISKSIIFGFILF